MHVVVETPDYLRDAKAAELSADECEAIARFVAMHPTAGVVIPGTGGARKLRFAGRGKGKSGGYRVVTYFGGNDIPVFLLNVFAKSDKIDLSASERKSLAALLKLLAVEYRKGVATRVKGWRKDS